MDTIDRSSTNLPAPIPANLSVYRDMTPALPVDQTGAPGLQINPTVILRGLTRHWWKILLLSLLVSAPIVFSIDKFIEPTYEASSLLKIEPVDPQVFSSLHNGDSQTSTHLKTQVTVLTSDNVLEPTVADALVSKLPMIKKSGDPKNDLRQKLKVGIIEGTHIIRVALELPNRDDAITIVAAVIQAYQSQATTLTRSANRNLTLSMTQELEKLKEQIDLKRSKLKALVIDGKAAVIKPAERLNVNNNGDVAQPTFNKVSEDHVQSMMAGMVRTDLAIIEAQSMLDVKRDRYKARQEESQQPRQQVDAQQLARIEEVFRKDADVLALKQEIEDTREHLDRVKLNVRQASDPARVAAQKRFDKLQEEYAELWESKYPEILGRLTGGPIADTQSLASIQELEQKIESMKKVKDKQTELFKAMEIDQKATNSDTFEAVYLNYQLNSLLHREELVENHRAQLMFEDSREHFRVIPIDAASAPKSPSNDKRLKYMAAAPVGVMFVMLGLFLLIEIKAERVADPDSLQTRVRSEVYSLPPLSTARSIRKLSESAAADQIDQFIQRLDHLRFALCGNPGELGKGRCVLITSAIGGEGKTTLAVNLAARCGEAGMSTLLIDSDFRRTTLCKMLDEPPDGPGLSDVLKNTAIFGEVVIPVRGGTFYLLPAGTPIQDTSRLLQGPEFGQLISQVRQAYDLIIIDSPPVLPVPDALILGRWADGAVIAARYDKSRFSQVERARRQLDNAGIAVLGTVINGMRNPDSYYGRYTYSRRRSNEPESSNAI